MVEVLTQDPGKRDLVSPACLGLLVLTSEVGQPAPSVESSPAALRAHQSVNLGCMEPWALSLYCTRGRDGRCLLKFGGTSWDACFPRMDTQAFAGRMLPREHSPETSADSPNCVPVPPLSTVLPSSHLSFSPGCFPSLSHCLHTQTLCHLVTHYFTGSLVLSW